MEASPKPPGPQVPPASGGLRFSCTLCGDCCTGNQVVRLCGGDLELLAGYLGLSVVGELRGRGVHLVRESVGGDRWVWRPRIRFRSKPLRQCPFLVNDLTQATYRGLCSLHPHHKPLVCTLSPLAREVEETPAGVQERWSVVPPVGGCPGFGKGEPLPVRAPAALKGRLDAEVAWMRGWIEASSDLEDEDSAWKALAEFQKSHRPIQGGGQILDA